MRIRGAELLVVTYRDSPDHLAGRQRWAAYQQDVLQAHLERKTNVRPPLEDHEGIYSQNSLIRAAGTVLKGANRIASLGEGSPPPLYRYCWPPVG
jgi:hypothetical protein